MVLTDRDAPHNPSSVPFLGEESAARHGIGVVLWAAQLEIAQALAGELIAQEAEGGFVIEPWWRG